MNANADYGAPHPFFKHRNGGRNKGRNLHCKWCGRARDHPVHSFPNDGSMT